jgi:hypothetical protein
MTAPLEDVLETIADDPLASALLMSMARLEETLTELGWDQPPRLMSVTRFLPEDGSELYGLEIHEIPDALPEGGGPEIADRLLQMADSITRRRRKDPRWDEMNLHAWVLTSEAWLASVPSGDEVAKRRLTRDGERHRVHARPDRIEVRMLTAVDRAGMSMQLVRFRDGDLKAMVQERMTDTGTGFNGTVPEALAALMEACE